MYYHTYHNIIQSLYVVFDENIFVLWMSMVVDIDGLETLWPLCFLNNIAACSGCNQMIDIVICHSFHSLNKIDNFHFYQSKINKHNI